jgi:lipopolysaccharide/colanic/teichoic acid biosynthesis glycosyltransferase
LGDTVTYVAQGLPLRGSRPAEAALVEVVAPTPLAIRSFKHSHLPSVATLVRQRMLDATVGTILALVALPFLAVFALLCAVTLRTSPLFVAARPGRRDQHLRVVKLRTLPRSYPSVAIKPELAGHRMPVLCSWLRRHHLDELPQLLEVVAGRMSLVGPRPRQNHEVDALHPEFDRLRREVRQGCTGLWQISVAADGFLSDAADYDLFYLRHMSVRLDLWILTRTIGRLLGIAKPVELGDVPSWALRREQAWAVMPYPKAEALGKPAIADDIAI